MPAPFLLIHGAWHAKWCFDPLVFFLRKAGREANAIDLPGHGENGRPGWGVTMAAYADATVTAARAAGGPVIAVGHSMGGIVIAEAAERAPEAFESLIFLAAFLPREGESLMSLGAADGGSAVPEVTRLNLFGGRIDVDRRLAPAAFYNACPQDVAARAAARLQPQSIRPLQAKATVSAARFARVRRAYLLCTDDRAISPAFQERMLARSPCAAVERMDADHSPFLGKPQETAAALIRLGGV
jgi:pimeloyl-ACP methyl ester carboxylesterase